MTGPQQNEFGPDQEVGEETAANAGSAFAMPRNLARATGWLAFSLLVLLTVWTTGGRLFMAGISDQTPRVAAQLSSLLGAPVNIDSMTGSWYRFSPVLEISGLRLQAVGNFASPLNFANVRITVDAPQSLWQRKLVIDRMSVSNLSLVLEQASDGQVRLAGTRGGGADYTDSIVDFLLNTRSIDLSESSVALLTSDGGGQSLNSIYMQAENTGTQHELELQFRINDQDSPSHLSLSMTGDPDSRFNMQLWADLPRLDFLPLAQGQLPADWLFTRASGSAGFWLQVTDEGVQELKGSLVDVSLQATGVGNPGVIDLTSASADFGLWPTPEAGWLLTLQDLALDWRNTPWETTRLRLLRETPDAPALQIQGDGVALGMLAAIVLDTGILPRAGSEALATLNPLGHIDRMHLETAVDGSYPGLFRLRANLIDVGVDAWGAAPAGSGLQGYLEMQANTGFAEVDSSQLTLHLPRLFEQPWAYDHVNGRVHWRVDNGDVDVSSPLLDVANSGLQGRVSFNLHNSAGVNGARSSDFGLQVGVSSMQVVPGKVYLPALENIRPTMQWLDAALQGGQLTNSGFVMRLSSGPGGTSDTTNSWYHVTGGTLQFDPQWQALEAINAGVVVRDDKVDVTASAAAIDGIVMNPGVSAVVRKSAAGGSTVRVAGSAVADTATGLAFLRNSPVKQQIGDFMDNWEATGNLAVDLALAIPVGNTAATQQVLVDVNSAGSSLLIPDYQLELEQINGNVTFSTAAGLGAQAVSASLFDFPVVLDIATREGSGNRTTTISGRGRASVAALQNWEGQARFVRNLLDRVQGEIDYDATIDLLGMPAADGVKTRLQLNSRLRGALIDYPVPFAKEREAEQLLQLSVGFRESDELLTLRYSDFFSGQLLLDDDGIERGQLDFGDRNRNFNVRQSDTSAMGLLITGTLEEFDYDAWERVAMELAEKGGEGRTLEEYLRLADVQVGHLNVAGQTFEAIDLQVQRAPSGWLLHGTNRMLAGELLLPDAAESPWRVTLDYLRFPAGEAAVEGEEVEEVDLLEETNPALLPSFDFTTAELAIGENQLGAFSFRYRPRSNGADIDSFTMLSPNSGIAGVDGTGGADITWDYRNGEHNSSFRGRFNATDLSDVLPAWGHGAFIESDEASFSGLLGWKGSPLAFSLTKATGSVLLDIKDGRFVDIDSGSSRLLGAFNFDALVRRLELDFSDLFRSGYAFDDIDGNLQFTEGVVNTTTPLIIDGPSSRLSINGEINLVDETIAADMQVRIPLSQNISLLAGLLGAWPIALSTYVASKIFAEQVDEFTTIVYRLDGPWDNVNAGFEAPRQPVTPPVAQPAQ